MAYRFSTAQRLLIKPFERVRFLILFILATGLAQWSGILIASQPSLSLLWQRSPLQYGIVMGILIGTLMGAAQWLILRRYVSDWKWIVVVSVSSVFSTTIQAVLEMFRASLFSATDNPLLGGGQEKISFLVAVILSSILALATLPISGYLQWYVLRPYVDRARWWIWTPLIAPVVVFGLSQILSFLSGNRVQIYGYLSDWMVVPLIQALCFCLLHKRRESSIAESALALAPDIVNYWDVQTLKQNLNQRISQVWKTDLTIAVKQLSYLVGVSRDGAIVCYEPVDQASMDNVDQTPLPELAGRRSAGVLEPGNLTGSLTDFAKFQVVFTPPSSVQVQAWRGMPLVWLGVIACVSMIGLTLLLAFL
jgi:hypothetical protein